jgi:pimeloyl-ACP methyl ester carboxylesterase
MGMRSVLPSSDAVGTMVRTGDVDTFVVDAGEDSGEPPILLLHGSGPGVTCLANWRPVLPALSQGRRVIAYDQLGFGRTATGEPRHYGRAAWTAHAWSVLDTLDVDRVDIVGNSMGGAVALSMAVDHPDRVRRLTLMGTMGISMALPAGLDQVWAYTPSVQNMERIIRLFAYDQSLATGDLVRMRYQASLDPAVRSSWEAMFPPPRQRWVDDLALAADELAAIAAPVLLVHGRDDRVVPLPDSSLRLLARLNDVRLHVFGQCGHWTMIERTAEFVRLVESFFSA